MLRYYIAEWPIKDPKTGKVTKKYVARLTNQPKVTQKELCKTIEIGSTLSAPEAQLALNEVEYFVVQALKRGQSVQIGDLFTIYLSIKSKSTDKKEEAGINLIEDVKVNIKVSKELKNMLKDVEFRKDRRK